MVASSNGLSRSSERETLEDHSKESGGFLRSHCSGCVKKGRFPIFDDLLLLREMVITIRYEDAFRWKELAARVSDGRDRI